MLQKEFAEKVKLVLKEDEQVIGLAAAGSWITDELDEFSDLDIIIVTKEKVSGSKEQMLEYANKFGILLNAFTGEHVGEPRLLICLYDEPLLHVDLKFVTPKEFEQRVEDPVVLLDKNNVLKNIIEKAPGTFPLPDYQWIEDRFWTWVHYGLLKIGRGEHLEAFDFLAYLRMVVLGPLLHIKNQNLPRGVRKMEMLPHKDYQQIIATVGAPDRKQLLTALENTVTLYRDLRVELYHNQVNLNHTAEEKVMQYLMKIKV